MPNLMFITGSIMLLNDRALTMKITSQFYGYCGRYHGESHNHLPRMTTGSLNLKILNVPFHP